jgi:hypothetical protein
MNHVCFPFPSFLPVSLSTKSPAHEKRFSVLGLWLSFRSRGILRKPAPVAPKVWYVWVFGELNRRTTGIRGFHHQNKVQLMHRLRLQVYLIEVIIGAEGAYLAFSSHPEPDSRPKALGSSLFNRGKDLTDRRVVIRAASLSKKPCVVCFSCE